MAGREVKGFVVTPAMAITILLAFLGVLGWAYKTTTSDNRDTRDAIIEMKTMLNERTTVFKEQQAELKHALQEEKNVGQMYREDQNKQAARLHAALRAKGIIVE